MGGSDTGENAKCGAHNYYYDTGSVMLTTENYDRVLLTGTYVGGTWSDQGTYSAPERTIEDILADTGEDFGVSGECPIWSSTGDIPLFGVN